ncbi:PDZ domain-containing protein [Hyphomicrobium sp. CS1GBMeth3]|uniref:PDZ domain-containing protein n=1 Tax=Hyphomicrobium sp. CS1GBMeth3 TaxID=1892845 RepID=UPI00092FF2C5|nr:PDZ domain-containing protein [Hyphomicrobium sp. CS1GBMeth3]
MTGRSLLAAVLAWSLSSLSAASAASPLPIAAGQEAVPSVVVRVADEEPDPRDIIRLLPPGRASDEPDTPPTPELPFLPGGSETAPEQTLRLVGRAVEVPVTFDPMPGQETSSYIGIQLDGINDPALAGALGLDNGSGVLVVSTTAGGPAAKAGLRFGDVVTAFDTAPVSDTDTLVEAIKTRTPGSQGTLTVWRVGDDAEGYLKALRDVADRGSTPAMMFLARLYTNGTGVGRDHAEAVAWYKKAAAAGSTNGMLLYGDALAAGRGAAQDMAEAERWIRKASDAGNVAAVFRLGRMYRDGEGVTRDPLEAVKLFKQAAEADYTPAMVAVGLMFEGGGGVAADHLQAVQWYKRAADAGDAEGMAALGTMYSTGRGVEKDPKAAAAWYIKAAERGQLLAIHNLAYHYDKGIGVQRNPQLAANYIYGALERRYAFTYQQMMQNSRAWSREFRRALQQKLAAGGYYTGGVDGSFGRTTFDALDALMQAQ